jgi:signal recognition particle GTPase
VTPADVNNLLKQFKMVQQMMKGAGKGRMPKLPPGMDLSELQGL